MQSLQTFGALTGPYRFNALDEEGPARLLILLHGWGADGRDLAELGTALMQMMPDLALWCPDAPDICSSNPMGRQWFELTERFFSHPEDALGEMTDAAYIIEAAIEAAGEALSISPDKIILGGFSQGGMMTLHIAQSRRLGLAGFASLSGALIGQIEALPSDMHPDDVPAILIGHGTADEVVPFAAGKEAQMTLEEAGYQVDFVARPELGHGIDMALLDRLGQFCHIVTILE